MLGSFAHIKMLGNVGLLTNDETEACKKLKEIYKEIEIEIYNWRRCGRYSFTNRISFDKKTRRHGKKIHSARSRNDQVLVDFKLFLRNEIEKTVHAVQSFFELLIAQSEKYKDRICSRLYTSSISHAIIIWFVVWRLCRKPG